MNTWLGSILLIWALASVCAQDFDSDGDFLAESFEKRRPVSELFGKRDNTGFGREVRRTRELFGKRQAYPAPSIQFLDPSVELPAKRRTRELFGKRSAGLGSLTTEQMEILANMLMERPRRARGGELFG